VAGLILGLDIGGVNTKVCFLFSAAGTPVGAGEPLRCCGVSVSHQVFADVEGLERVLGGLRSSASRLVPEQRLQAVGVTTTAELCDVFASRVVGVRRILEAVRAAFEGVPVWVWTLDCRFEQLSYAYDRPLAAAAANWLAGALVMSRCWPGPGPALLLDMGSTTTDIVPLVPNKVLAAGYTDQQRLACGELVYTGLLRTPVQDIAGRVYLDGACCRTTAEYFTVAGDVYRLLGWLDAEQYGIPAPDKRSPGSVDCARRLARLVAQDLEAMGWEEILLLAHQVKEKHLSLVLEAIWQVLSRKEIARLLFRPDRLEEKSENFRVWPDGITLILAGLGVPFLAEVARRLGVGARRWWELVPVAAASEESGAGEPAALTAFAVAWLLADCLQGGGRR